MFLEINEQLADLRDKERRKANLRERLVRLEADWSSSSLRRDQLADLWSQEQQDVERLKSISLGALFYSLIGQKAQKLSQEEAEALQAKLQYDEAAETADDIAEELAQTREELDELDYVEAEIALVLQHKERIIRQHDPALAAQLQQLGEDEASASADLKELGEALEAGEALVRSLRRAKSRLNSARSWGTYDMLGGGIIATSIKHRRIDDARRAIHKAQTHLRRFEAELRDVAKDVKIKIDIGSGLAFADFFFDGLIVDWIVQGKIKSSLNEVERKLTIVSKVVAELRGEFTRCEQRLAHLQLTQSEAIEQA